MPFDQRPISKEGADTGFSCEPPEGGVACGQAQATTTLAADRSATTGLRLSSINPPSAGYLTGSRAAYPAEPALARWRDTGRLPRCRGPLGLRERRAFWQRQPRNADPPQGR